MGKVKMANIKIRELKSELMTEAIANAQARRNNFISELSEEQAAEVLGGMSLSQASLSQVCFCPNVCPPTIIGIIVNNPEPTIAIAIESVSTLS
ncbi:MAG: hypothetical protein F6K17_38760 [Okeania sp. SIO3C4]|nr:hypothetical protein [Okeania sp. SIO3C4]